MAVIDYTLASVLSLLSVHQSSGMNSQRDENHLKVGLVLQSVKTSIHIGPIYVSFLNRIYTLTHRRSTLLKTILSCSSFNLLHGYVFGAILNRAIYVLIIIIIDIIISKPGGYQDGGAAATTDGATRQCAT